MEVAILLSLAAFFVALLSYHHQKRETLRGEIKQIYICQINVKSTMELVKMILSSMKKDAPSEEIRTAISNLEDKDSEIIVGTEEILMHLESFDKKAYKIIWMPNLNKEFNQLLLKSHKHEKEAMVLLEETKNIREEYYNL